MRDYPTDTPSVSLHVGAHGHIVDERTRTSVHSIDVILCARRYGVSSGNDHNSTNSSLMCTITWLLQLVFHEGIVGNVPIQSVWSCHR